MTATDLADLDADRTAARKVFIGWLVLSTMLTLIGNAAAATLDSLSPLGVKLAVHLIPPLIALLGFHALTTLAKAGAVHRARTSLRSAVADAGPMYVFAVVGVLGITGIAMVMSYAGLYAVARAAGLSPALAAVWPLSIDLAIAVSTAALFVLRPISNSDLRAARRAAKAAASTPAPAASPRAASPALAAALDTAAMIVLPAASGAATDASPQLKPVMHHPDAPDAASTDAPAVTPMHHDRAAEIVRQGIVAKPVEEVALVLAHLGAGASARRIQALTGIDPRTVGKIRDAAAAESISA